MTDTYTPDAAEQIDTLQGIMAEIQFELEQALTALNAGMMETPGPVNKSPWADLAIARSHLKRALSAYEPAPEDVKYITAAPSSN